MAPYPMHIDEDTALAAAGTGEGGIGAARAGEIWKNAAGDVKVAIWKAEPDRYTADKRAYAETFVMVAGEADVTVGTMPPRRITPGAIVHVPAGCYVLIDVHSAMAKVSTAAAS